MYKKAFLISLLMGVLWGLTIVYIVIEHNPQMVVYDTTKGYDIIYLAKLFIIWFALVTFGLLMLILIYCNFKKFKTKKVK